MAAHDPRGFRTWAAPPSPNEEGRHMTQEARLRDCVARLGVPVGTAAAGAAVAAGVPLAAVPLVPQAHGQPKGNIPDTAYKVAHMTFFTGAGAVLGEPSFKGHTLAAEEINAQGGLLGKRKIETLKADENAGTDANVKEMRRLKLSEKVDLFTGVISSGNTPALGPVAEELKLLTIFVDGCTDFLFDKAVPNPHYIFRITNIQSADGSTCAVGVAQTWPSIKTYAHIHPDYSYGRNCYDHFTVVTKKLLPNAKAVSEAWPKLFATDFTPHITKTIAAKPDLLVASGGRRDDVAWNNRPLQHGLFDKMKVATTLGLGAAPQSIGKDHPEGVLSGVHANSHFNYPAADLWERT